MVHDILQITSESGLHTLTFNPITNLISFDNNIVSSPLYFAEVFNRQIIKIGIFPSMEYYRAVIEPNILFESNFPQYYFRIIFFNYTNSINEFNIIQRQALENAPSILNIPNIQNIHEFLEYSITNATDLYEYIFDYQRRRWLQSAFVITISIAQFFILSRGHDINTIFLNHSNNLPIYQD